MRQMLRTLEPVNPDGGGRWNHVRVTKYLQTYYVSHIDGKSVGLEAVPGKGQTQAGASHCLGPLPCSSPGRCNPLRSPIPGGRDELASKSKNCRLTMLIYNCRLMNLCDLLPEEILVRKVFSPLRIDSSSRPTKSWNSSREIDTALALRLLAC